MRNVSSYKILDKTTRNLSNLYSVLGFLVLWDVMTTYMNIFVLADKFGEYGIIANIMMQLFGWSWGLAMIPIEFAIFASLTYVFSKSKDVIKIGKLKVRLRYLPAIALAVIIVNNVANLVLFLVLSKYFGTMIL